MFKEVMKRTSQDFEYSAIKDTTFYKFGNFFCQTYGVILSIRIFMYMETLILTLQILNRNDAYSVY